MWYSLRIMKKSQLERLLVCPCLHGIDHASNLPSHSHFRLRENNCERLSQDSSYSNSLAIRVYSIEAVYNVIYFTTSCDGLLVRTLWTAPTSLLEVARFQSVRFRRWLDELFLLVKESNENCGEVTLNASTPSRPRSCPTFTPTFEWRTPCERRTRGSA